MGVLTVRALLIYLLCILDPLILGNLIVEIVGLGLIIVYTGSLVLKTLATDLPTVLEFKHVSRPNPSLKVSVRSRSVRSPLGLSLKP